MSTLNYDVAVIGSGPGGYVAAIRCAQLGFKTCCIDSRDMPGGTCLNIGCIPSKALLQSTQHAAFLKDHAKEHGINIADLNVDFGQMNLRKEKIVKGLTSSVAALFKNYHIDWIQGLATFEDDHHLRVNENVIEAKSIIIATGSEPISLPFLPLDEKRVLSSTGALALLKVPKKMLVVGGGVIGVEIASVYNRLGTEIIVIEMLDQICATMDHTLNKQLLQILKKQGMTFYLGARVLQGKSSEKNVELVISYEGKEVNLQGDVVLVAVGRRPSASSLQLDKIGLKVSQRGFIEVDDHFRTSIPHIYAIGDVIEGMMLAHRASEEGVAVAEIIAGKHPRINYMTIPNIVYTHPECAALGYTEQEARNLKLNLLIGMCYFRANPRARCSGELDGCVKIIGEANSHRVIGMHILGANASELIAEGMIAIHQRATLDDIADCPHGHPTQSEAVKEAAMQALGKAIHI